jgi:hypothetical protein
MNRINFADEAFKKNLMQIKIIFQNGAHQIILINHDFQKKFILSNLEQN